jgi:hypothetical protein
VGLSCDEKIAEMGERGPGGDPWAIDEAVDLGMSQGLAERSGDGIRPVVGIEGVRRKV